MTDTGTSPLEKPWEDVTVTLLYQDGPKLGAQEVRLNRAEIENRERQAYLAQAEALPEDDPRRAGAIAEASAWELTPEMFQERIVRNVEQMATSPVRLEGAEPHIFRILPWAVREVRVSVDNVRSALILRGD